MIQQIVYPKSKSEIIYTSKYTDTNSELFKMNNEEIFKDIIKNLEKFYANFNKRRY